MPAPFIVPTKGERRECQANEHLSGRSPGREAQGGGPGRLAIDRKELVLVCCHRLRSCAGSAPGQLRDLCWLRSLAVLAGRPPKGLKGYWKRICWTLLA